MRKKKPTHGGARKGAGAPKKAPTAILSVRVSAKHKARFEKQLAPAERRPWLERQIDGRGNMPTIDEHFGQPKGSFGAFVATQERAGHNEFICVKCGLRQQSGEPVSDTF